MVDAGGPVAYVPGAELQDEDGSKRQKLEVAASTLEQLQPCRFFALGACALGRRCRFAHPTDQAPTAPPCRFFKSGQCSRGDSCTFYHDTAVAGVDTSGTPCRYYAMGSCRRGNSCLFSHDATARHAFNQAEGCWHFEAGHCWNGDACPYPHSRPVDAVRQALPVEDATMSATPTESGSSILRKYSSTNLARAKGHEVLVRGRRAARPGHGILKVIKVHDKASQRNTGRVVLETAVHAVGSGEAAAAAAAAAAEPAEDCITISDDEAMPLCPVDVHENDGAFSEQEGVAEMASHDPYQ